MNVWDRTTLQELFQKSTNKDTLQASNVKSKILTDVANKNRGHIGLKMTKLKIVFD